MLRVTDFAHQALRQTVQPGDWAVDATVGNGHDTLFLAQLVGPTVRVVGFDIQATALAVAARRVAGHSQVSLHHCGHECLNQLIPPEAQGQLAGVMFNLGYLPGAPKDIVTRTVSTLSALNQALDNLKIGGMVTMVIYPGHPGGEQEANAVRDLVRALPGAFSATHAARLNATHPAPELLVIERIKI
jgi:SAM-dependent methyltransferase